MNEQQDQPQSEETEPRVETEEPELTDEELDAVAGGRASDPNESYIEQDVPRYKL